MKTLRLCVRHDQRQTTFLFPRFPVRIGREAPVDFLLQGRSVSRRHATIDLEGDRLLLRDDGSRYGTWVRSRSEQLRPGEAIDLAAVGNEFHIGSFDIRAELVDDLDEERHKMAAETEHYERARIDPKSLDDRAAHKRLNTTLATYAECRAVTVANVLSLIEQATAFERDEILRAVRGTAPSLEADLWIGGAQRPACSNADADAALAGLRQLAATHVPYAPPLAGDRAIPAFVAKLDAALTALADVFSSLRYAYRAEAHAEHDEKVLGADVTASLLEWMNPRSDAAGFVREQGMRMLTHHFQLVEDVVGGVNQLFADVEPARIEIETRTSIFSVHQRRWSTYRSRYASALVRWRSGRLLGDRFERVRKALGERAAPTDDDGCYGSEPSPSTRAEC